MVSTFWLINIGMTREGYAAQGLRHAFLPAIVSTSGRIHGEILRLLFNLADKKTSNSFLKYKPTSLSSSTSSSLHPPRHCRFEVILSKTHKP